MKARKENRSDRDTSKLGLSLLSSSADFRLRLVLDSDGETLLVGFDSEFLPWVGREQMIHIGLSAELAKIFEPKSAPLAWEQAESIRETLQESLSRLLESYEITIWPELNIVVEQQGEKSLGPVREPEAPWLKWITYQDYIFSNCDRVTEADVDVKPRSDLRFSPIPEKSHISCVISCLTPFQLRRVIVRIEEEEVASSETPILVTAAGTDLELPLLGVRHYRNLLKVNGALQVTLVLANDRELHYELHAEVDTLDGQPVALYVDMGSTYTKVFKVSIPHDQNSPVDRGSGLTNWAKSIAVITDGNKSGDLVEAWGPMPTEEFVFQWKLTGYSKRELVGGDSETLAYKIAEAVRSLTVSFAQNRRPVASVAWSFPEMDSIDVDKVSGLLEKLTNAFVLDRAFLVREHEALRQRFKNVLSIMARVARDRKQAQMTAMALNREQEQARRKAHEEFQRRKEEYDNLWFFEKWFTQKPNRPNESLYRTEPLPTLEEWHQQFLDMSIDPDLKDVLILDAGGFSLDTYCKIGNNAFGRSFEAGGMQLTDEIRGYLGEKRGTSQENVVLSEAEDRKKKVCCNEFDSLRRTELGTYVESWTRDIYEEALNSIADWVKKNAQKKGVPVILTGGAMDNFYLRDLIRQTFEKEKVSTRFTISVQLSEQIAESQLMGKPSLSRFRRSTFGFAVGSRLPEIAYDVVGGLLNAHLDSSETSD
jgi:hypothetical protein